MNLRPLLPFVGIALVFALIVVPPFAWLVVEAYQKEQGPPAWRHYHWRDGVMEECDSRICAPKPEVDL